MRKILLTVFGFVLLLLFATPAFSQLSRSAIQQIESLNREKEARTPVQRKIDSKLLYAAKGDRGEAITPLVRTLETTVMKDARGLIAVDISVSSISKTLITTIENAGGKLTFQSERFKTINASLPLQALEQVAAAAEVLFIYPAAIPENNRYEKGSKNFFKIPFKQAGDNQRTNNLQARSDAVENQLNDYFGNKEDFYKDFFFTGNVTSQGDVTHRAAAARSYFGVTGTGVKIGVLSDGVVNLAAAQASGDLGPVTVLPGQTGTGDEGTAMLEIIHDLAPGAQLYYATAFGGVAGFAQNILNLRAAGCDIIVDDVSYSNEGVFQDGPIAQAVNTVTASGALYFSSAANSGNKDDGTSGTWEGDFNDAGTGTVGTVVLSGGTVHNFEGGTTNNLTTSNSNRAVRLFWSDPLGRSGNDYDLYVLNSALTAIISSSTNVQNGNDDPFEDINSVATGRQIVIFKKNGAAVRALHLNFSRGRLNFSTQGETHGHSAAVAAFSVAATPAYTAAGASPNPTGPYPNPHNGANVTERFSSDGPRRMFYNADTTAITPGNFLFATNGGNVRQKPDITAADGVSVTGAGGFSNPFFGTSAAAPHAAAIAGLIKSGAPTLTPAQIRSVLTSTAIDIETPGIDRNTGAGIVMAYESLQAAGATTQPYLQAGATSITAQSCAPGNGVIDPGETVTVSFCIQNGGTAATANSMATLQNTGGITNASASQNYGAMGVGATACRSFSFTAYGTCGSTITASINVQDGAKNLGTLTYTFVLGVITQNPVVTNTNNTTITIPTTVSAATPYPSNITLSGINNPISKVTVQLNGFNHTYPADLDVLLVSPAGQKVILMSLAGGGTAVTNANVVFDDAAAAGIVTSIPSNTTTTYKPSDYNSSSLISPAPARPYAPTLSAFNGFSPNGVWSLYVADPNNGDGGSIASGWTLNITTSTATCCTTPPPASIAATAGTPQTTIPGTTFAQSLQATVRNASNTPVIGARVIFTAPTSGASGNFANGLQMDTAFTDSYGNATASAFTSNATAGSYTVTATVAGVANPASFNLTNVACNPTYVITSSNDNGPGTLREALLIGCPVLSFSSAISQINLNNNELLINRGVKIAGPGADKLTVAGTSSFFRIFNISAGSTDTVSIAGISIKNGYATQTYNNYGGGVLVNSGIVTLTNCWLTSNTAGRGGAVYVQNGKALIDRCTLSGNTAYDGGGINVGSGTTAVITNSTITGNTADAAGGGLSATDNTTVASSTIFGNKAPDGSNILVSSGSFHLGNSIVAGGLNGSGNAAPELYTASPLISDDYNLIQNTTNANITGTTAHNLTSVPPRLYALAYRSSAMPVLLPQLTSPAINVGNPTLTPADADQRDKPRRIGSAADIGAIEANYTVAVSSGTNQTSGGFSAFADLLRARVQETTNNIAGDTVVFTAPATGASGTFPGGMLVAKVVTDANGIATAPTFSANNRQGSYNVVASIGSAWPTVNFALTNATVLPVIFGSVTAQMQDCAVQLQWTTLSEINTKDYTVEYSIDGNTYNNIATLTAKGTTSTTQQYRYTHTNPATGTLYYRIRQTDKDGATVYTKVMTVQNNCSQQLIVVRPNPVKDQLTVQINSTARQTLLIYDATGRQMVQQVVTGGTRQIEVKNWAKGVYTLAAIQDGKTIYTTKVVKE